jgi:thymidylate kinase
VLLALEGIAGAGKSTVRDSVLAAALRHASPTVHLGQFAWLDPRATRVLIDLRAGRREADDLNAANRDLVLHAQHNLAPARAAGHVIADRWTISTACLLALVNRRPTSYYLKRLATVDAARPDAVVLLTTPLHICLARLWKRDSRRRFTEEPAVAERLAGLYDDAAEAWTRLTGQAVARFTCRTPDDLDLITSECLALLGVPATQPQGDSHAA